MKAHASPDRENPPFVNVEIRKAGKGDLQRMNLELRNSGNKARGSLHIPEFLSSR